MVTFSVKFLSDIVLNNFTFRTDSTGGGHNNQSFGGGGGHIHNLGGGEQHGAPIGNYGRTINQY